MSGLGGLLQRGWKISIDLAADHPDGPTVCVTATRRFVRRRRLVFGRDKDFDAAVTIAVRRCVSAERNEKDAKQYADSRGGA